jgi:hypothetical protein
MESDNPFRFLAYEEFRQLTEDDKREYIAAAIDYLSTAERHHLVMENLFAASKRTKM